MGDMLQLLFACVAIGSAVTGPMSLSQWLCHGLRLRWAFRQGGRHRTVAVGRHVPRGQHCWKRSCGRPRGRSSL